MRKVFRYISYAIIYLIISLASAYGVITISVNYSNNQSKGNVNNKPSDPTVPTQLTSMIENIMNCGYLSLDLSANISMQSENVVININSQIDLTSGIENILLDGKISAELDNLNQNFDIGFAYQNGVAYFELLNGKISVNTSNIIGSIQQIINLAGLELPELGIEDVLAELDLNTVLGFLSNLEELPAEDGSENMTLKIKIPMIDKDLYLYCNKDYKLNGLLFDYSSEDISASINATIEYPNELNITSRNPEEYIETCNLLDVVQAGIKYIKNNENYAFNVNAKYSDFNLNGNIYVDPATQKIKFTTTISDKILNAILINKTLYIEFSGVYFKFNLNDLDKIADFIEKSFNINLPIDKIISILEQVKNGNYNVILEQINLGNLQDFNINDIDLSIIEKVYVEDNNTFIAIKNVGTICFSILDKNLQSIAFTGSDIAADLKTTAYQEFALTTDEKNYIDIIDILPTIENAISIFKQDTINGSINIEYKGYNVPVNIIYSQKDNYIKVSFTLKDKEISIQKLNNKIYIDVAGVTNFVVNLDTITDSLIDFLSNIKYDINLTKYADIFNKLKDIFNPSITPLLIKSFEKTSNGANITLFNDITLSLQNENNIINISTNVEDLKINASVIGDNSEVVIPTFNDEEYNTVESLLDLAEAVINSGLLQVAEGAYNTFKSSKVALNLNATYNKENITATIFADVANLKAYIALNYKNENVNIILENEVVYIEYNNIFLKFNLSDATSVLTTLNEKLNLNLPLDLINNILNAVKDKDIDKVIDIVSGEIGDDFKLDISKIDIDFFRNIVVEGNDTTIAIGDKTVTFTVVNKNLTAIKFNGFGVELNTNVVDYEDKTTVTSKENYINVADFFPTIENVVNIVKANTLSGKINLTYKDLSLKLNYVVSKEDRLYANISTTIKDMLISIDYLDGKVYFNADNKLMLLANVDNLPTAITEFMQKIGVEITEETTEKLVNSMLDIINPSINPLLITSLVKTENGINITLLEKFTLSVVNGSNEITLNTEVKDITANITLVGNDKVVVIPTFNDEEYNTVESLLDLAEAVINSGLLQVAEGAYNTFKSSKVALNLNATYNKENITATIFADVANLKAYIALNYKNENVNIILENEVVYIEYNNIFLKFNLSDAPAVFNKVIDKLNITLPTELINNILNAVKNKDIDKVIDIVSGEIGDDFKLDISKIDIDFFRNIVVEGNDTTIAIGDKTVTFTVVNKNLTAIKFNGFGVELNTNVVDYEDKTTVTSKENYINVAELFPTIENAVNIINSNTISSHIDVKVGTMEIPVDIVVAKTNNTYAKIDVVLFKTHLYIYYYDNKVLINYGDIKIKTELDKLPDQLRELTDGIDTLINPILGLLGIDLSGTEDVDKDSILDPSINPLLIKHLTQTENGFIIRLYNDMDITINNSTNKIEFALANNSFDLQGYILGSEADVDRATLEETNYADLNDTFRLVNAAKNMSKQKDFHIKGTVNLKVLGINIGNIPLDIQIKVDQNLNLQLAMELSLPDALNLGSLVGFDMVNTNAYDRKIKIYYLDGFVHLYRTENAGSMLGKKHLHEVYAKVAPGDLFADILNYVQFTFDFTDKMIELMTAKTDHGRDKTDNPNYEFYFERALKGFTVSEENNGTQTRYDLTINLAELADNPQLGDFKISLYVGENENGESYLQKLPIELTVASVVNIVSTNENAISIVDYGKPVDDKVVEIKNFVEEFKKYNFEYEAQMERNGGSGEWTKLNEKVYTLTFVNGEETISTITGPYLKEITLPILDDYDTTENGLKVRKHFVGWMNEEGIEFNHSTMPKGSKTLLAKWENKNYITLNFVTGTTEVLNIVELPNTPISLPTPTVPKQTIAEDGKTVTTYKFDCWCLDSEGLQEFTSQTMPSENISVYANWIPDKIEVRAEFKLYNNNNLIHSIYLPEGEEIDLSEIELVNNTTKFYLDANFENEFTGKLIMSNKPLTLYIRNKFTVTYKSQFGNMLDETIEYYQGENLSLQSQATHYVDDAQVTTRNYYYFGGWEINGIVTSTLPTIMPDENLVIIAVWTNETYYKISYDLRWFWPDASCALGSKFITPPPTIEDEWILSGTTLDLTQQKYRVSGVVKKSAFNNKGTYTSTSWGTSAWGNYSAGKGFTSIVIDKPLTLYACWQEV